MDNTSSDIVLVLGSQAAGVPLGTIIRGFGAGAAVSFDSIEDAQIDIGVDGELLVGGIHSMIAKTITLAAGSESNAIFDLLHEYKTLTGRPAKLAGTYIVPAVNRAYGFTEAYMTSYSPAPAAETVLGYRTYVISISSKYYKAIPIPTAALPTVADINSAVNSATGG